MNTWVEDESMNYCKSGLKDGKPIIVKNLLTGKEVKTNKWIFRGYDKDMNEVKFVCEFIKGKKDKHGARVKLVKYSK